jgi:hypothetical protein
MVLNKAFLPCSGNETRALTSALLLLSSLSFLCTSCSPFVLVADHEMNCSTAAMRHITSSLADPFTAVAGAAGALFGPLHGGANEVLCSLVLLLRSLASDFLSISLSSQGGAAYARGHRLQGECAQVLGGGQGPQEEADGLWPQDLQELRSSGSHHQEDRLRGMLSLATQRKRPSSETN